MANAPALFNEVDKLPRTGRLPTSAEDRAAHAEAAGISKLFEAPPPRWAPVPKRGNVLVGDRLLEVYLDDDPYPFAPEAVRTAEGLLTEKYGIGRKQMVMLHELPSPVTAREMSIREALARGLLRPPVDQRAAEVMQRDVDRLSEASRFVGASAERLRQEWGRLVDRAAASMVPAPRRVPVKEASHSRARAAAVAGVTAVGVIGLLSTLLDPVLCVAVVAGQRGAYLVPLARWKS